MPRYIPEMRLQRHSSLIDFLRDASPFLMRHEAEHGLMLGVAAESEAAPAGVYCAVVRDDDGEVIAAALRTPAHKLILSRCDRPGAATLIADSVAGAIPDLPGVLGPPDVVNEFVERAGGEWRPGLAHRIYECRRVMAPENVAGIARRAEAADRDTLAHWMREFVREAIGEDRSADVARERTEVKSAAGALYVWEVDGEIVSTAAAVAPTPHAIRVSAVYTPPEHRGHGYASALTAAVTARQLEMGRALVFLYTDLANPISNRIYQRIGYVPVADVVVRVRPGVSPI